MIVAYECSHVIARPLRTSKPRPTAPKPKYGFGNIWVIMSDPLGLISSNRFHRRVNLDTICGPLTVSFAEMGCATGPALLFIPGMFASRYVGIPLHPIAERAGVRLLVVDRPGMGASTDVPLNKRIAAWVDLLPRLLAHLGITRVNLVAHSNGTVYLLNTWAQCRELVGPEITLLGILLHPSLEGEKK